MNTFCGLDFGTSNSTIGTFINQSCRLVPLEADKPIMRSAIFCDGENKEWIFGQEGITRYLEGTPGRLMMALKSVLGTTLMDDKTLIFNEMVSYADILAFFIKHLKQHAEHYTKTELTHAVLGRPVHFHDHDAEKDRDAQNTLEKIALSLGFKEVTFQYEPIAAALTYESTITTEQLALIIDMGGGTSDFSVVRLRPDSHSAYRSEDVLANAGIHIAGTDFDQKLSLHSVMPLLGMGSMMQGSSSVIEVPSMYYYDLTLWHTLANLYTAKTISHVRAMQAVSHDKHLIKRLLYVLQMHGGHQILNTIETSKQRLSDVDQITVDLDFIENELTADITRNDFNHVIQDPVQRIIDTVLETIKIANLKPTDINAIFYTGGSTKIPYIREQINPIFQNAKVIQGDAFGSVGLGLTMEAERRYG